MILLYNTERRPFATQKLAFDAGLKFSDGYNQAVYLKTLLRKVGGFGKSDLKLVSVCVMGALEKWQKENSFFVTTERKIMRKAIKDAKNIGKKQERIRSKVKSDIDFKKPIKVRG